MLYDRPYMRPDQNLRSRNLIFGLIIFNVMMYAVQLMAGKGYTELFALTSNAGGGPHIWSFLTYSFLHSPMNMGHIVGNMIGVFFLGRALLPELGEKRFLQLYFGSTLTGGILWYIVSFVSGANLVYGASGAVFGLITCFGLMYASLGIAAFGFIFLELINHTGVAHSAHLGGMLGGYLFFKFIYVRDPGYGKGATFKMPEWMKPKANKPASKSYSYKVNINNPPGDMKKEVDRILDKINSKGFGALTPKEKKILDEAGDSLKKR